MKNQSNLLFIAAIFSYVISFCYVRFMGENHLFYLLFTIAFIVWVEIIAYASDQKRTKASVFYLVLLLLQGIAISIYGFHSTIMAGLQFLFLHCCAVYYVLQRNNALVQNQTSSDIIFDLWQGFLLYPFSHFMARLATIKTYVSSQLKFKKTMEIILSIIVITFFMIFAFVQLAASDDTFAKVGKAIADLFHFSLFDVIWYFVLSLPVGMYLFGLLHGSAFHETKEHVRHTFIPAWSMKVLVYALDLLYLLFFISSFHTYYSRVGSLLHPSLTAQLASSFATQGFYNLIAIMLLNFVVSFLAKTYVKSDTSISTLFLSIFTLLFVVLDVWKLLVYIHLFGITLKRYYAVWFLAIIGFNAILLFMQNFRKIAIVRIAIAVSSVLFIILCLLPNETMVLDQDMKLYMSGKMQTLEPEMLMDCHFKDSAHMDEYTQYLVNDGWFLGKEYYVIDRMFDENISYIEDDMIIYDAKLSHSLRIQYDEMGIITSISFLEH